MASNGLSTVSKARQLLAQADLTEALDLKDKAAAMQTYLKGQGEAYDAQFRAAEIKLMCERRAGELLAKDPNIKRGRPKNSHDVSFLSDHGISHKQSSRWQEEATVGEAEFQEWVDKMREEEQELTQAGLLRLARSRSVAAASNTGEIEWYTPEMYVEMARKVMGNIDTDPAASHSSNEVIKADTYYTQEEDGLVQDWHGNVWMNPPYAAGVVNKFAAKLCEEIDAGHCRQAIVLLNNATDTKWLAALVQYANAVCFKTGRIAFINQDGKSVSGAAQGQMFLYFGKRLRSFRRVFSQIGWIAEVSYE